MKGFKCVNGHWYDSEVYDSCPICGAKKEDIITSNTDSQKIKKSFSSLFAKKEKGVKGFSGSYNVAHNKTNNELLSEQDKTDHFFKNVEQENSEEIITSSTTSKTKGIFSQLEPEEKTVSVFENYENTPELLQDEVFNNSFEAQAETEESIKTEENFVTPKETSETLTDAIQRVSAVDSGKTLSYFNAITNQQSASADAQGEHTQEEKSIEPVVGWLVCVAGAHLGDSFNIFTGKNTIGRDKSNRIVLNLDKSVSRENNAMIVFEPKRSEFYLHPGTSDNLVYLNDEYITVANKMKKNDIIEIGATQLMLIPLCGEDFSWTNFIKGME